MRVLGIDYGRRRLGLALSDATGTLASPWQQMERPPSEAHAAALLVARIQQLQQEDDGLEAIVIGWPRTLDGQPTHDTARVEQFAETLRTRTGLPVTLQDERLSSHDAEARLAVQSRDWRARKARLDAAAAAVILQDYLDARPRG